MYELIGATNKISYIDCPAKIGVIRLSGSEAVIIDSGNDKDAGKKIKRILEENGLKLKAIYNTHAHADHVGGNAYLQQQTGCSVYAPGMERDMTEHPIFTSALLYGGFPPDYLRHKFLLAAASDAQPLSPEVLPEGVSAVPLPGHTPDMVGYRTDDGAFFIADSLLSEETLKKYQISFITDVKAYIDTLQTLMKAEADVFIPSHAAATGNIAPLASVNLNRVIEIGDKLAALCREPQSFDGLLKAVFEAFSHHMTLEQHALIGSTVRSYMTWLCDENRAETFIDGNVLYWRAK